MLILHAVSWLCTRSSSPCGLLVCWYVCLILWAVLIKLLTPFYLVAYWCAGSCV